MTLHIFVGLMALAWFWDTYAIPQQGNGLKAAYACLSQPDKVLDLSCSTGHMVLIHEVLYGYSEDMDRCFQSSGDCYFIDDDSHNCVGQASCSINLPSGGIGKKIPGCDLKSNYIQVQYECIKEEASHNICQKSSLNNQRGYIQTPHYPLNYPPSLHCELTIKVHQSQTIELYLLDFDIAKNPEENTCQDVLYISSAFRSFTKCGYEQQHFNLVFKTLQNTLKLVFNSSETTSNRKGFWLYYEALPFLPSTPTLSTSSSSTTSGSIISKKSEAQLGYNTSTSSGLGEENTEVMSSSESPHHSSSSPSQIIAARTLEPYNDYLPVGAIIGGVLGSLLFILAALLILLFVKRHKEQQSRTSRSELYLERSWQEDTHSRENTQGCNGPYIHNEL